MIEETNTMNGDFEKGVMCCDNEACRKVLYEWFDEDNAPDEEGEGVFAFSVKSRIIFNKYPTNFAVSAIRPTYIFSTDDRHIGYIIDFDVLPLKLDFCSTECSRAWLNEEKDEVLGRDFQPLKQKKQYGVLVLGQRPSDLKQLVMDNPSRFESIMIGNFAPTSAPRVQFDVNRGQIIKIAGKDFDIRISNALMPGEKKGRLGLSMQTFMVNCPMHYGSPKQTCNQLMQVVLDFIPSLWICPKCNGILVIDTPNNAPKHDHTHRRTRVNLGHSTAILNYYFGKPDWGNKAFLDWIARNIHTNVIAVADAYEENSMPSGLVMNTLVDLTDAVNLFGHLIS